MILALVVVAKNTKSVVVHNNLRIIERSNYGRNLFI